METVTFVILIKREPSNIKTQRVIFYKSVQELNGNTFVLSLTLPFGVKMKLEWLVMKWGCHGKKGQVILIEIVILLSTLK